MSGSTGWGKVGDFSGYAALLMVVIAALVGFGAPSLGAVWVAVIVGVLTYLSAVKLTNQPTKSTGFRYPMIGATTLSAYLGSGISQSGGFFAGLGGALLALVLVIPFAYVMLLLQGVLYSLFDRTRK